MDIRSTELERIWEMRQKVMYPAESLDFVKLEEDNLGIHLGLYVKNQLVSVISLFIREGDLQFRKFATLDSEQGKGYGTQLLHHVMEWASSNNIKSIWCNARLSATSIYEKMGMKKVGDGWQKYGLDFIKMEKQLS